MDDLTETRRTLHRVAAHVLGRRRHQVSGRFGLRAAPGGFATPAFGDGPEVVRLAGTVLVHEVGAEASYRPVAGSSLRELAAFAGTDVAIAFSCGEDGPEVGDVESPIVLDPAKTAALAAWLALGWRVLDTVVSGLGAGEPATIQLWPEHFDAGTTVTLSGEQRVNLGASPGDDGSPEPYLYIGPWGPGRPGDPAFWNAPFGALRTWSELTGEGDPAEAGGRFLRRGLEQLTAAVTH